MPRNNQRQSVVFPTTSSSNTTTTIYINGRPLQQQSYVLDFTKGRGRLGRFQMRLQSGRLWWFGNRLSDVRYWIWRVIA